MEKIHFTKYENFTKIMETKSFLMSNIKTEKYKKEQRECGLTKKEIFNIIEEMQLKETNEQMLTLLSLLERGYKKNISSDKTIEIAPSDQYVMSFTEINEKNLKESDFRHHKNKYGEIGICVNTDLISSLIKRKTDKVLSDILMTAGNVLYSKEAIKHTIITNKIIKILSEYDCKTIESCLHDQTEQFFLSIYEKILYFTKLKEDEEGKKDLEYRILKTSYDEDEIIQEIKILNKEIEPITSFNKYKNFEKEHMKYQQKVNEKGCKYRYALMSLREIWGLELIPKIYYFPLNSHIESDIKQMIRQNGLDKAETIMLEDKEF